MWKKGGQKSLIPATSQSKRLTNKSDGGWQKPKSRKQENSSSEMAAKVATSAQQRAIYTRLIPIVENYEKLY